MSTVPTPAGHPLLREQVKQHLRLVELARLDSDVGKDGRGETEPRREVTFLQHPQRHPGRRVGLRQSAEPQLEQAQSGVSSDKATRRTAPVNLLQHRLERLLDRAETLGHDQHPQQRRPRVPVRGSGAGVLQRLLQQCRDLAGWPACQQQRHRLRDRKRREVRLLPPTHPLPAMIVRLVRAFRTGCSGVSALAGFLSAASPCEMEPGIPRWAAMCWLSTACDIPRASECPWGA